MKNPKINSNQIRLSQHTIIGSLNVSGLLALAGISGPPILIIADYTAAFTSPGYNIIRDSISSLALTRMGWLQTIGFLAIGLLVETFVIGLIFNINPRSGFHLGMALLVFSGFGLLTIGAFHTNAAGTVSTMHGTIHGFVSKAVCVIFPLALWLISSSIKHDPRWRHLFHYTIVTVILGFILLIVVYLAYHTTWFGLLERLLVWNMLIWVEVTAIQLLRLSLRRGHQTGIKSCD